MDNLLTGWLQSWLITAAATLGPLIALLIGFLGADWWLRQQLKAKRSHLALNDDKALKVRRDGSSGHPNRVLHQTPPA
jgi:hypothetical protein